MFLDEWASTREGYKEKEERGGGGGGEDGMKRED